MNLRQLADTLKLTYKGPEASPVLGVRDIERLSPDQAQEDGFVYFIETAAIAKRHPLAAEHGIILTTPALADKFPRVLLAPENGARPVFFALLRLFDKAPKFPAGVSPQALVHPSATVSPSASVLAGAVVMEGACIGEGAVIYPGVVLEPHARVGAGTVLFPNVVIGHHCEVGGHCIIHGGTVIGADGFGFYDEPERRHKVPHIGNVVIADHVELGASCTVDRSTIESTTIGEHTKLDDQVHIGHNCRIGRYIYIVGNSAVGGSVVIEDGAMLSGMVIIKDHLKIAAGSIVMGMSGVAQDTEPKTVYFGSPARPAKQMHRMNASLERLPELLTKFRALEERVGAAKV